MLVLTRKLGETVIIGSKIKVTLVDIQGRHVRLGIEAPADVSIHRGEVYDRIVQENIEASKASPDDVNLVVKALKKTEV